MASGTGGLSAREAEVLDALADRLTNAEIAARLFISVRTVESHVSALLRKLDAPDRRALTDVARRRGLDTGPATSGARSGLFVGRDGELDVVNALTGEGRLVTIVGPGGAGKTRLAVEFAQRHARHFPDGIVLVELAPVNDPSLVAAAAAAATGIRSDDDELADAVARYVAPRRMLVVIDNCEHLIAAAADLAHRIVSQTGHARVVATSREPLLLRSERTFRLGPLALADAGEAPDTVDESPAVVLFADRAQVADPSFSLTSDNRALVRDICAAVDGLPLALELAAARLGEVSLGDLATGLRSSLSILSRGPRDLPERHQALRATIDWSYRLLGPAERRLLEHLAVFGGPFSGDAARAVCGFEPLVPRDIVPLLAGLVSKSLVTRHGADYRLLEPVRQFAVEGLDASGGTQEARGRHLAHFAGRAASLGIGYTTSGTPDQLDVLRRDEANIRAALTWAFQGDDPPVQALAVRLVGSTVWRWFIDGLIDEAVGWCERALDASASTDDVELRLIALHARSTVALTQADMARALALTEEALVLAAESGNAPFHAFALDLRGNAHWATGELGRAETDIAASVRASSALGIHWHEAFARAELARVLFDSGDHGGAASMGAAAFETAEELGEPMPIGFSLDVLANHALARGDIAAATDLAAASFRNYRSVDYREGIASAGTLLARLALAGGDLAGAHAYLVEVAELDRQLGHRAGLAAALEAHAQLRLSAGDVDRAATLLKAARHLRQAIGVGLTHAEQAIVDQLRADLEASLGKTAFARASRRGKLMELNDVVRLAAEPLVAHGVDAGA